MATEVNQALATHAQGLFGKPPGAGSGPSTRSKADLEELARLLLQVRLRKALADPGLPPEPKRAH